MNIHEYENGSIKFISHYRVKGELFAKTAFIGQENSVTEQRFLPDGELNDQYFVRFYDQNDNLIREIWKNHDKPSDIRETTYIYDKNNRVIQSKSDSSLYQVSYVNNTSTIPESVEQIDLKTKKGIAVRSFQQDSLGNITARLMDNKIIRSYEYEYDRNGNWIRKIVFDTEAKIPREIIEREIEYN